MKLKKTLIYSILLASLVSSSLMVGCSNDGKTSSGGTSSPSKNSQLVKDGVDFQDLNTKEVNDSIEKYSKQVGISNVEKISIDWQLATESFTEDKGVSQYLFAQKKLDIDSPYIIARLMEYIAGAKTAGQDALFGLDKSDSKGYILEPKEKLESINKDLKAVKDGKLKESKFEYDRFRGYAYYPDAKKGIFDEYRPTITLVGKDGKSLDIDFRLDALKLLINKSGTSDIKKISDTGMNYFEGLLLSKNLSDQIGKDTYKLLKDHKIDFDYFMSTKTLQMPEKLKEPTYGDRFKLYWAGVDTIIRSNGFKDGIEKYLGKEISIDIYHIKPIQVLEYTKDKSKSSSINSDNIDKDSKISGANNDNLRPSGEDIYDNVGKVIVLRYKDKNIGAYLCSEKNLYNLDHKGIAQVTGGTYEQWLDKTFEDDADRIEIAKLDSHQFIKKYVDMMTVKDFDLNVFDIPELDIYSGKVSDSPSPLVSELKNNIISSSLVSAEDVTGKDGFAPDFKDKPNDIDVRVVIDYKFKDEVDLTNGENETIFSLRKISDTLGYRIVSQGI